MAYKHKDKKSPKKIKDKKSDKGASRKVRRDGTKSKQRKINNGKTTKALHKQAAAQAGQLGTGLGASLLAQHQAFHDATRERLDTSAERGSLVEQHEQQSGLLRDGAGRAVVGADYMVAAARGNQLAVGVYTIRVDNDQEAEKARSKVTRVLRQEMIEYSTRKQRDNTGVDLLIQVG